MKKSFLLASLIFISCSNNSLDKAKALSQELLIIDTHIDIPFQLYRQKSNDGFSEDITELTTFHFDYPRALEGGLNLPFFSIYIPARTEEEGTSFELANNLIKMMNNIIDQNPDKFIFINSPYQMEKLKQKDIVGIAYGIENGAPIEGKLENIKYFAVGKS